MPQNGDILVVIPDEDLPELAQLYEKHQDVAAQIYCAIKTAIRWNQQGVKKFLFTSPNNSWREDGTIFVFVEFLYKDLIISTLTNNYEHIYEALEKTKMIKSGTTLQFYSLDINFTPTILDWIKNTNKTLMYNLSGRNYSMTVEEALKLDTSCPPEVLIKKLDVTHVNQINNIWPHKYPNSDKYMTDMIKLNDCYGVFLKEKGDLVAWAFTHHIGILGIIHTEDNHRKKGHGSLITKFLSKEIAKLGLKPIGYVVEGNTASESMFEKMGFKDDGQYSYIKIIW
ncbi:uncharacterized protein LOC109603679 [Aethina tumida]|uniref:uncharacterized protein LOC109603679 n=1 Tax=Aethina tumida TaxID=116153 RepID=UPI0021492CB8|nr:uncharacterized protein LOC109603679 [Aethina tumida]